MNADELRRLCRTHDPVLPVEAVFKMPDGSLAPLHMTVQHAFYLGYSWMVLRSQQDGPNTSQISVWPYVTVSALLRALTQAHDRYGADLMKRGVFWEVVTWSETEDEKRNVRAAIVAHKTHNGALVLIGQRLPGNEWPHDDMLDYLRWS